MFILESGEDLFILKVFGNRVSPDRMWPTALPIYLSASYTCLIASGSKKVLIICSAAHV